MSTSGCSSHVRALLCRIVRRQGILKFHKGAIKAPLQLLSIFLLYMMMAVWASPVIAQTGNPALSPTGYHPWCDQSQPQDPSGQTPGFNGTCIPSGLGCDQNTDCYPVGTIFDLCATDDCVVDTCTLSGASCTVDACVSNVCTLSNGPCTVDDDCVSFFDCPGDVCEDDGETCVDNVCSIHGGDCNGPEDCRHCSLTYDHCNPNNPNDCAQTSEICEVSKTVCEPVGIVCQNDTDCNQGIGEKCYESALGALLPVSVISSGVVGQT